MYEERGGNLTSNAHFGIDPLAIRPDLVESRKQLFNANQPSGQIVFSSNRSKTSASFSSGVPNTEKRMKARRRRRSAFIVSRCLEPLMKNEARVFELASQTSVKIY